MESKDLDQVFRDGFRQNLHFDNEEKQWNEVNKRLQSGKRNWLLLWLIPMMLLVGAASFYFYQMEDSQAQTDTRTKAVSDINIDKKKTQMVVTAGSEATPDITANNDKNQVNTETEIENILSTAQKSELGSIERVAKQENAKLEKTTTIKVRDRTVIELLALAKNDKYADQSTIGSFVEADKATVPAKTEVQSDTYDTKTGYFSSDHYSKTEKTPQSDSVSEAKLSLTKKILNIYDRIPNEEIVNTDKNDFVRTNLLAFIPTNIENNIELQSLTLLRTVAKGIKPIKSNPWSLHSSLEFSEVNSINYQDSSGLQYGLGVTYNITNRWHADLSYYRQNVDRTTRISPESNNLPVYGDRYIDADPIRSRFRYIHQNVQLSATYDFVSISRWNIGTTVGARFSRNGEIEAQYVYEGVYQPEYVDTTFTNAMSIDRVFVGVSGTFTVTTRLYMRGAYVYHVPISNAIIWRNRNRFQLGIGYKF